MNRTRHAVERMAAQPLMTNDRLLGSAPSRSTLLDQIIKTPGGYARPARTRRRYSPPRLALVGACVAVAVAVSLILSQIVGNQATAFAATPQPLDYHVAPATPPAAHLLNRLAQVAETQSPPARHGSYEYIRSRGWNLNVATDTNGNVLSARIQPTTTQVWIAADGSARSEQARAGQGNPTSYNFPAGTLPNSRGLPTDPVTLQRVLAKSHHALGTFEWFVAVHDVWSQQVVSSHLESALLRVLAAKPGMIDRGTVIDRAGRHGVAVSTDSDQGGVRTRSTLIFDPTTGMLLDSEYAALTAGKLPIKAPAITGYTIWLSTGYAHTDHSRP